MIYLIYLFICFHVYLFIPSFSSYYYQLLWIVKDVIPPFWFSETVLLLKNYELKLCHFDVNVLTWNFYMEICQGFILGLRIVVTFLYKNLLEFFLFILFLLEKGNKNCFERGGNNSVSWFSWVQISMHRNW